MTKPEHDDQAVKRLQEAVARLAIQTRGRALTGTTHEDADDAAGTSATDDAVGFDPLPLLRTFHRHGANPVVIGQVAGIMHGSRDLTGDLDLLWDGAPHHAATLAAAFASAGATLTGDDGDPLQCDASTFLLPKVLFRTPGASGDCCTPALPWHDLPIAEFLHRSRVAVAEDGTRIRYVTRTDLIRMRRAIGRTKDLRRADELERLTTQD